MQPYQIVLLTVAAASLRMLWGKRLTATPLARPDGLVDVAMMNACRARGTG